MQSIDPGLYIGETKVEPVLWYGARYNGSNPDGIRTGNMAMHRTLPVNSKFRCCGMRNGIVIGYIKPDNWNEYEDGEPVDDTVDIMIELPDAYYTYIQHGDYDWEVRMSVYPLDGYTKFSKKYVGAYEGYTKDGVLRSIRGEAPTVNKSRSTFLAEARNNRDNHYAIYTYEIHKFITWCFAIEYATLNSQKAVNNNLTADGYHQGGLGTGCTTGTYDNRWSFIPCGWSDSLGTGSGEVQWSTNGAADPEVIRKCNRYRGIENPFGHIWKNCCDVIVGGTDNKVYMTNDFNNFGVDKSLYTSTGLNILTTNGQYVRQIVGGDAADIFCKEGGGNSSTYFWDYHWTNPVDVDRTVFLGGNSDGGSYAGLFSCPSYDGLGDSASDIGCRLTYIP